MAFEAQPAPATPYPDGAAGIQRSVQAVAQGIRDGRLDPEVKGWAIDVLTSAGIDGRNHPSIRTQAAAILRAIQAQTIYTPDPGGAEWVQAAHVTLCLRDRCIRGEDCDGLTVATGAAMLSLGLPVYAVRIFYGAEHQQHILVGLIDEQGHRLYADPSTNDGIQTSVAHAVEEDWIDPLDQVSRATGTSSAEMVTLGAPMKRELYFRGGHWFEFRYGQWWMHAGGKWLPGPTEAGAKGLPGMGHPFKRGGSFWASVGQVDVELRPHDAGLGKIFGYHTAHELDNLLSALTYQVAQLQNAATAGLPTWQASDPNAAAAWLDSFNEAVAGWTPIQAKAEAFVTTTKTALGGVQYDSALALDGTTDMFDEVAKAFEPLAALDRMLRQSTFPAQYLPSYAGTPQPDAPDLDLSIYQLADSSWQAVKQFGQKTQNALDYAAPYLALGAAAVGIYALYRVAQVLPRRRA